MTIATPEQMRVAVERWARARGWLAQQSAHGETGEWMVDLRESWRCVAWLPSGDVRHVDEHTLLLWACTVEAGLPPVEVRRCEACPYSAGPCLGCNGTGRVGRDPARMVLDAAPQWEPGEDHGRHGQEPPRCDGPGDAEASDHLAVFADELQTRGEPLGEWMALWLAGNDEETGEAVRWLNLQAAHREALAAVRDMLPSPSREERRAPLGDRLLNAIDADLTVVELFDGEMVGHAQIVVDRPARALFEPFGDGPSLGNQFEDRFVFDIREAYYSDGRGGVVLGRVAVLTNTPRSIADRDLRRISSRRALQVSGSDDSAPWRRRRPAPYTGS